LKTEEKEKFNFDKEPNKFYVNLIQILELITKYPDMINILYNVVTGIVNGLSWIPKSTAKSPMTTSNVSESIQWCLTESEYNH